MMQGAAVNLVRQERQRKVERKVAKVKTKFRGLDAQIHLSSLQQAILVGKLGVVLSKGRPRLVVDSSISGVLEATHLPNHCGGHFHAVVFSLVFSSPKCCFLFTGDFGDLRCFAFVCYFCNVLLLLFARRPVLLDFVPD